MGHILCKYGWDHDLAYKVMNLNLTVCQRVWRTSQFILLYFQRVKCFVYTLLKKGLNFKGNKYCHLFVELVFPVQVITK